MTSYQGEFSVFWRGDNFLRCLDGLLNDDETLIFDTEDGTFGDELMAISHLATVKG